MTNYNAKDIKHYEGLDAIRKRPNMYIGDTESNYAPIQLVLEGVTNSVDEAMNGFGKVIDVKFTDDGYCCIKDRGRGIPIDDMEVNGKKIPACIAIATMLNTGGKFDDNGEGSYKTSGGLNGIGLKAICALSSHFIVIITRDGKQVRFETKLGKLTKKLYQTDYKPKKGESGTFVKFKLDESIVKVSDFFKVEKEIKENCKVTAYLNKGIKINVKFGEKLESYYSENGIQAIIEENISKQEKSPDKALYEPIIVTGKKNGVDVEICFTHTNSESEKMFSFVNGLKVPLGGTHVTGFRLSMSKMITEYIKKNKLYGKTELEISGEDVREGLVYAVAVKLSNPRFHGQTKDSLGSNEAQSATQSLTNELLENIFNEKPNLAKVIALRVVAAAKGRIAAKRAREVVRKNLEGNNLGLPTKLKDCVSTNPEECELFLIEGNSAGGSAEVGRDVRTQAILSLRGKIPNTQGESISNILKNAEIQSIIAALGTGIGETFDISKIRYHKIISMTDADVDGSHIRTLIFTLFYNFFKPIIEAGYLYYANSPLYIVKQGNKTLCYLKDDNAREEWILQRAKEKKLKVSKYSDLTTQQITDVTAGIKFNYIKGLGEMNPEQLASTTMRKGNRILTRVTMKDAESADEAFRVLMDSKAVEERKKFIEDNALNANLDI